MSVRELRPPNGSHHRRGGCQRLLRVQGSPEYAEPLQGRRVSRVGCMRGLARRPFLLPVNEPPCPGGGGTTPSCCSRPNWSSSTEFSTTLPPVICKIVMPVIATCLPVGGRP